MDDSDRTKTMRYLNSSFPHNTTPKQLSELKSEFMDLPGSPVVKTLHFHYRGYRFDPLSGNYDPTWRAAGPKKKKRKSIELQDNL